MEMAGAGERRRRAVNSMEFSGDSAGCVLKSQSLDRLILLSGNEKKRKGASPILIRSNESLVSHT